MPNASSRYGQTVYLPELQGSRAVPLLRRRLSQKAGEDSYDEDWLQSLLFQTPEILPTGEFDPVFDPAMPLCRELPTDAGPIDLAYVSDQGRLSIVECKLWRNPEARRDAVSQILDYAKEISRWSYEELNAAVCRARAGDKHPIASLFELVREQNDTIDEMTFVDDVTRSLASGQFLLLVVGDGIREGVERIADYLSQSAGLRFTFGLVELAIFDMPEGSSWSRGCLPRRSKSNEPLCDAPTRPSWWKIRRRPLAEREPGGRSRRRSSSNRSSRSIRRYRIGFGHSSNAAQSTDSR